RGDDDGVRGAARAGGVAAVGLLSQFGLVRAGLLAGVVSVEAVVVLVPTDDEVGQRIRGEVVAVVGVDDARSGDQPCSDEQRADCRTENAWPEVSHVASWRLVPGPSLREGSLLWGDVRKRR